MVQKRAFNLLYKLNLQLSFADKLYKFILPLRVVMILFMGIVLLLFGARFFFDRELNQLIKQSEKQVAVIEEEIPAYERKISKIVNKVDLVSQYKAIYDDKNAAKGNFIYSRAEVLEKIMQLESSHPNILVNSYSISHDEESTVVSISGEFKTFADVDNFLLALKGLDISRSVYVTSQSAAVNEKPRFVLTVVLKDKINA